MHTLRDQANAAAQSALRACHDYRVAHGHRSTALDEVYSAAERVMDAVVEYERLVEVAREAHPRPVLVDHGDHYAYPAA